MSEDPLIIARLHIRSYRRLMLWLSAYCIGAIFIGSLASLTFSGWTMEFGRIFAQSGLVVAPLLLLVVGPAIANVQCPKCEETYYVNAGTKHRLLHVALPIRRKPCCQCGWNAFGDDVRKVQRTE